MSFYIGIDIGTSGTKALVMDAGARVLATATSEHGVSVPRAGWSEQDPNDWWKSTVAAVGAVLKKSHIRPSQVGGIGLSGQMHGLVVTDDAGECLRPAIIWNDQRTALEALEIEQKVGGRDKLIELVGNRAMTSFTLTKLLWLRKHQPRVYAKIRHLLLPKDYVRLRLTGEYVGDVSDMSGTLMLDQRTRTWSGKIISAFEIDKDILPPVVESHEIAGRLTAQAAAALRIPAGTPVVAGGGDQPVGAVGNGVVAAGLMSATMGTSGVVLVHSRQYVVDPEAKVQTFCASVEGEYCMFGCILSAGGSLQWYRNVLGDMEILEARRKKADPYELIMAKAATAAPGCEGVFWLPYLTGERTPHADPCARAAWVGIHSRTTRAELARSVIEGATFAMNDALMAFHDRGLPVRQIRLSGGGARSEFWRQLQANIYGSACVTINAQEGPAYGAAILAAVGTGRYASVKEACSAAISITRIIKPQPALRRVYHRYYEQYRRLYPALKDEFARIALL
ncbi:MAG: xylulokinase [Planctomycetes bacterium]|nr:xylulokinase [Planctomycetota bacterium]